jgi:hypothetical protein
MPPRKAVSKSAEVHVRSSGGLSYMPDARECALLLLLLIDAKEKDSGQQLARFRVAELTLKRLWGRQRIEMGLLEAVNEWLLRTGRALFFAGSTYAVVGVKWLEGWPRVSSKRLSNEITEVMEGRFDFDRIVPLLAGSDQAESDD